MSYRFKAKESVAENVRRIAREEVDSALGRLTHSAPGKRDEAIHEARKSVKKVRGLLRLVEPALGKTFRRENAKFRDAGRYLSVLRDAAALLETISHLEAQNTGISLIALRQGLQQGQAAAPVSSISSTIASLQSARERISRWSIDHDALPALSKGLRKTFRAGRRALQKVVRKPSPESHHELRKRVKDLWYQVRLLHPVDPKRMQTCEDALKEIESRLGEDHNLSVLHDQLQRRPSHYGGKQRVSLFLPLVRRCQRGMQAEAIARARIMFESKPGDFLKSMFEQHSPDTFFSHP